MIKLYSYFRSSSAYRVRIALNLKELDYEIIPVHLVKDGGEQYKEDFKKLNPSSKVPVLVHDNKSIFQSVAIIEYLEESFPTPALYPTTALDKAHVRTLCEIINSDIQPLQNLRVLNQLTQNYKLTEEQKNQWIQHWIAEGFNTFEKTLEKTAGQYSFGNTPTAADCFLMPQIYNAQRFQLPMNRYPLIQKVFKNCSQHKAFVKAHPDNQPDTP